MRAVGVVTPRFLCISTGGPPQSLTRQLSGGVTTLSAALTLGTSPIGEAGWCPSEAPSACARQRGEPNVDLGLRRRKIEDGHLPVDFCCVLLHDAIVCAMIKIETDKYTRNFCAMTLDDIVQSFHAYQCPEYSQDYGLHRQLSQ